MKNIKKKIQSFGKWVRLLKIDRRKIGVLTLLLLFTTILTSCRPLLFGYFIDFIASPKKAILILVLIGSVDIGANCMNYVTQRIQFLLVTDVEANAKRRIFQKMLSLSYDKFIKMEKGKFVNTLQKDAEVFSKILTLVVSLVMDVVSTVSVALIMMRINWKLTILYLIALPINLAIFKRYGKKIKEKTKAAKKITDKYLTFVNEVLLNMKTIKNFFAYNFAEKKFDDSIQSNYRALDERNRFNRTGSLIVQLINSGLNFIIILLGLNQIGSGGLTIGGLVSFQTYSSTLNRYLMRLSVVNAEIQEISISLERVEVILQETEIEQGDKLVDLTDTYFQQDVRVEQVSFGYDKDVKILSNVTLTLEQRKIVSIVGNNGMGKTTLLNLISLMYKNYEGNIYIGENEIRKISDVTFRNHVCYVFQQSSLFSLTLRENFLIGKPDASEQEMREVCEKVMLWDFISLLPEGLNTIIGGDGITLSEGQKQKVVIARALLSKANIYLLDEITANLDVATEVQICKILLELKENSLILNVSHRRKILEISDVIYEIKDGEFFEMDKERM